MSKVIIACLLVICIWAFALLPFEVFDEQSHFATVQYLIERQRMPVVAEPNLTIEEEKVERIFGVMTDGTNEYAYNSGYRPEWTGTISGKYEDEIKSLNTPSNRSTFTIHQAAIYPPLYYVWASFFYWLANQADFITRLYMSRLGSLILTAGLIGFVGLIGNEIFGSKKYSWTLVLMVLLYPMTTFIGVGVNSDNLHNLLYAIFSLLCLRLIKNRTTNLNMFWLGVIFGLDMLTKPQAYIMLPIMATAVLLAQKKETIVAYASAFVYFLAPALVLSGWQEIPKLFGSGIEGYIATRPVYTGYGHFRTYLQGFIYTATHEMIVWYWGVFKWTTVVLPRMWWWVAIRIVGIAGIGALKVLTHSIKIKAMGWRTRVVLFSLLANIIYAGALFWFDWQFYQQQGHSLGMQARYYMPLLPLQMAILLIGLMELGWNEKIKEWIRRGIILFFVGLQLTAVYTVASSYYDVSSLQSFIIQASQYKPAIAKGAWWYLWITGYLAGIIYLTWTAIAARDEIEVHEKATHSRDRRTRARRPTER